MIKVIKIIIPGMIIDEKIYLRYKISRFFYRWHLSIISRYITYKTYRKYNCIISYKADIKGKITIPHPIGIVIGAGVKIGKNVTIYQNVTLGRKNRDLAEYPSIGDNVIIYCNSVVAGKVNIGENSIIGCNSVVLKNIEPNKTAAGLIK